ncbi:hypothetical protein O6H91_20G027600 [Diphasiastrum complanatum]|uniref:Uncharacterized protein n=2 Tax=Diphasiastrum complanatum TaxID=34168 RepID=A0ACC2ANR2_DIPCM|nr:hypothetical protein O6H91_20G027100 [Diphasiastrum complanatum]KAJ7519196.1 hypothetical protein O6H91_20G027600 [Diphasiastrum complanatum]
MIALYLVSAHRQSSRVVVNLTDGSSNSMNMGLSAKGAGLNTTGLCWMNQQIYNQFLCGSFEMEVNNTASFFIPPISQLFHLNWNLHSLKSRTSAFLGLAWLLASSLFALLVAYIIRQWQRKLSIHWMKAAARAKRKFRG